MKGKNVDSKAGNEKVNPDLKKLGARIKALRIKKGYSNHEKFAFEHDIDRVQYGRYERGVADMQYTSLLKVVRAFDMTLDEFFRDLD